MTGRSRFSGFAGTLPPPLCDRAQLSKGSFSLLVDYLGNQTYAYKGVGPLTEIYGYAEVYIPSASYSTMANGGGGIRSYGDIIDTGEDSGGPGEDAWQGVYFTNSDTSNVYTPSQLWLRDYWCLDSDKTPVSADTWYQAEFGFRFVSDDDWEAAFGVNGTHSAWAAAADIGFSEMNDFTVGANFGPLTVTQSWYTDNVQLCTDDWWMCGGTPIFSDDFESGDFSAWDGTVNPSGMSVTAPP